MSSIRKRLRIERDERGFSIVMVAIMLVAMLSITAIVIDLGRAYASRRQMQNAADASAIAATRALDKAARTNPKFSSTTLNDAVATTASDVATTRNGSQAGLHSCTVIDRLQNAIAPCSPSTGWASSTQNGGPAGVRVATGVTENTAFAPVIGQSTTTARSVAAATIQPLVSGRSPFIICGNLGKGGYDLLNPDGTINVAKATALGPIPIQASQVPDCFGGGAFKGKAKDDATVFTLPAWIDGDNGNGNDHTIQDTVAGATPCPAGGPYTNCDLIIPIADDGQGNGQTIQMHITALAVFHITGNGNGNPKYYGTFLAAVAPITAGQGGTGNCNAPAQLCVIKLVQ